MLPQHLLLNTLNVKIDVYFDWCNNHHRRHHKIAADCSSLFTNATFLQEPSNCVVIAATCLINSRRLAFQDRPCIDCDVHCLYLVSGYYIICMEVHAVPPECQQKESFPKGFHLFISSVDKSYFVISYILKKRDIKDYFLECYRLSKYLVYLMLKHRIN